MMCFYLSFAKYTIIYEHMFFTTVTSLIPRQTHGQLGLPAFSVFHVPYNTIVTLINE